MIKKHLSIAIPASIISDTPHLREKTSKIGLIARSAAIFRVEEIIVYPDNIKVNQQSDLKLIELILKYLETPQYLRKELFPLNPDLQYAGILPPLRTPHHPVSGKTKHLKIGEYREGLIHSDRKEGLIVDIGVQQPALLRSKQFSLGERLTVQIVNIGQTVEVQPIDRSQVPMYWGYIVKTESKPFGKLVAENNFDLKIATARIGNVYNNVHSNISKKWVESNRVIIGFGAPSRGLHEIVQDEGLELAEIMDFVINTIPNQGTATVRTEEALLATLATFNNYLSY